MIIATNDQHASAYMTQQPAEEYHADHGAVSNSMLSVFRQSRVRFQQRFVTGEMEPPEPTPALRLGTLLHLLVLEPERYAKLDILDTGCQALIGSGPRKGQSCGSTGKGKDTDGRWLCGVHSKGIELTPPHTEHVVDSESGRLVPVAIVSEEEHQRLSAMADAIATHPIASKLLGLEGESECVIRWTDKASGLPCKMRADRLTDRYILDLKTSCDPTPEGFAKSAFRLGYHRQAAWYPEGVSQVRGERLPFVFIVVGSDAPHDVAVYELDDDALALGENQNRSALSSLATCYRNDEWRFPWQRKATTIALPKYAEYSDEWTIYE